jgi:cytochrome P450
MRLTPREHAAYRDTWRKKERRADRRAAVVAWVIAEIYRDPSKRSAPFEIEDFMPTYRLKAQHEAGDRMSDEEMHSMVLALNAAFGGTGGE